MTGQPEHRVRLYARLAIAAIVLPVVTVPVLWILCALCLGVAGPAARIWRRRLFAITVIDAVVAVSDPLRNVLVRSGVGHERVHTVRNAFRSRGEGLRRPDRPQPAPLPETLAGDETLAGTVPGDSQGMPQALPEMLASPCRRLTSRPSSAS